MVLHVTYKNSGSGGAADPSSSTSSIDQLAARQVQQLVATGQLRPENAVLPRTIGRSFILSVSPSDNEDICVPSLENIR